MEQYNYYPRIDKAIAKLSEDTTKDTEVVKEEIEVVNE